MLAYELGVDETEITRNANLVIDLGADSLDVVEIAYAMEDEFDIEISDAECYSYDTVGDVVDLVFNKLG